MAERVLSQSALGKAVFCVLGQFPKLERFLVHPEIPLDTNRVENAIRPFCMALLPDGRRRCGHAPTHLRETHGDVL